MSTSRLLGAASFLSVVALSAAADAQPQQSIIKSTNDHPEYKVELEPHLDFGWANLYASNGFGLGVRASIPIVQNGFIPNLNNSVAISFGLDWLRYSGCYGRGYFGVNGNDIGCGPACCCNQTQDQG